MNGDSYDGCQLYSILVRERFYFQVRLQEYKDQ